MDFCGRGNEPSGFHKMRGNSRLVEELLALQERLFSLVVSKIVGRPCLMTPYFFFFLTLRRGSYLASVVTPFTTSPGKPFLRSHVCLPAGFVTFANIKTWRYVMSGCCIVLLTLL